MKSLLFLSVCLFLHSCTEKLSTENEDGPCPEIICTQEFRSVTVRFKNAAGEPVIVKDFTSLIKRTGRAPQSGAADQIHSLGSYAVVTDGDTKNLLTSGDTLDVSAINPQTNQRKTVQFVVKGGKCACHIEKVSGPEEVVFN
ncbi:MAG TPA: hypothetical protein VGB63_11740 [Pedobacter sp.]|jgi:hypothetical protein